MLICKTEGGGSSFNRGAKRSNGLERWTPLRRPTCCSVHCECPSSHVRKVGVLRHRDEGVGYRRFLEDATRQSQQSKHPKRESLKKPYSLDKRCLRSVCDIPPTKWEGVGGGDAPTSTTAEVVNGEEDPPKRRGGGRAPRTGFRDESGSAAPAETGP